MTNFGGAVFYNRKFNFENNLQIKQHNFHCRCPIILNKNVVWGLCGDRLGDDPLGAPLDVRNSPSLGGGNCAYVARGIDAPEARYINSNYLKTKFGCEKNS